MRPFVGKHYTTSGRLLIIAESHYLPESSKTETIDQWYELDSTLLSREEQIWTSTREILEYSGQYQRYESKGHTIFRNLEQAVLETGFCPADTSSMFQYVSFMNFFQRPANHTGDSIVENSRDVAYANDVVSGVISVIQPRFVFFVSSKAYKYFRKDAFENDRTGHSCHPASRWWNRKSWVYTNSLNREMVTGRMSFVDFISSNKVFSS